MSAAVAVVRRAASQGLLVWVLVLAVAVQAAATSEFFLTSLNVSNATGQMVPLAFASMGQMCAILVGAIDLSVGATARVAALMTAGFIDDDPERIVPVILGVLAVSALIGAVNGAMVVWLRIHPLIATLISFNLLSGAALAYTTGPVGGIPSEIVAYMHERFLGLPYPAWVVVALLVALGTLLTRTRFGRNAYAVGGDSEVARRAGVDADAVRFRMLVLCSVLAGAAGIVLAFRQGIGDPRVAQGLELDSIVAVVIGGVSIFGGRGGLIGMLGGVVFLNVLRNAMNLQGVDPLLQQVVSGALVIVAVALFTRREA
jgi:ribose/xylose/arabinose/galactoside ABC-type transport system permease subunit